MVSKRLRVPVVVDTNVFVRAFRSTSEENSNWRVLRLWLTSKSLQLIVSSEIVAEYLEIFESVLRYGARIIAEWRHRFERDSRSSVINLGRRTEVCRDLDDNKFLDTAFAGKADWLITNDSDLLEIPANVRRQFPFAIVTPTEFLRH